MRWQGLMLLLSFALYQGAFFLLIAENVLALRAYWIVIGRWDRLSLAILPTLLGAASMRLVEQLQLYETTRVRPERIASFFFWSAVVFLLVLVRGYAQKRAYRILTAEVQRLAAQE